MTNTLAYYNKATITAKQSFIVQTQGVLENSTKHLKTSKFEVKIFRDYRFIDLSVSKFETNDEIKNTHLNNGMVGGIHVAVQRK